MMVWASILYRRERAMVDNEKVRIMTRIAIFEKNEEHEGLVLSKYFREDYVKFNMLKTLVTSTICFWLFVAVSLLVDFEKYPKSTSVIIVPVRYYRRVNISNAKSESFGILGKQPSLSHVKQYITSVFLLDIQTYTMFYRHTCDTGILN